MATTTQREAQQRREAAQQASDAEDSTSDSSDSDERVSDESVLKALVDHVLSGPVHPDQRSALADWRDQHTTDEERDARLTDDERAAKEREGK